MKKGWIYAEKIIAIYMLLIGVGALTAICYASIVAYNYYSKSLYSKSLFFSPYYGFCFFLSSYQSSLLDYLISIFAGITLLMNKRSGWVATIALALNWFFTFFLILLKGTAPHLTGFIIFFAIQFVILFIVVQKPYRNKYEISAKIWLFVVLTAALLFAEPYIFNLI